jgi:hypothetical protein
MVIAILNKRNPIDTRIHNPLPRQYGSKRHFTSDSQEKNQRLCFSADKR